MIVAEMADAPGIDPLEMTEKNRVREGQKLNLPGIVEEGRLPARATTARSCAPGPILEQGATNFGWRIPEQKSDNHHGAGKLMVKMDSHDTGQY